MKNLRFGGRLLQRLEQGHIRLEFDLAVQFQVIQHSSCVFGGQRARGWLFAERMNFKFLRVEHSVFAGIDAPAGPSCARIS
jgi:hypothetical protein